MKLASKNLHRDSFSKLEERVAVKAQHLHDIQGALQNCPFDVALLEEEKVVKAEYQSLLNAELALLRQKAKAEWLYKSDTNSSFFHSRIKERRISCRVTSIYNDKNELITEEGEIHKEFLRFYKEILGTSEQISPLRPEILAFGPNLSEDQKLLLCAPVSVNEIKEAIFSIPSSKSPGPDGFTSGFYEAAWHIVGPGVSVAIKDFFSSGKLLREVNTTMITLVPKVSCPKVVGDYKTITCCNILYKAITKILTNRLQLVMNSIIDNAQGDFIRVDNY